MESHLTMLLCREEEESFLRREIIGMQSKAFEKSIATAVVLPGLGTL